MIIRLIFNREIFKTQLFSSHQNVFTQGRLNSFKLTGIVYTEPVDSMTLGNALHSDLVGSMKKKEKNLFSIHKDQNLALIHRARSF